MGHDCLAAWDMLQYNVESWIVLSFLKEIPLKSTFTPVRANNLPAVRPSYNLSVIYAISHSVCSQHYCLNRNRNFSSSKSKIAIYSTFFHGLPKERNIRFVVGHIRCLLFVCCMPMIYDTVTYKFKNKS
jgi:hypothetical protein